MPFKLTRGVGAIERLIQNLQRQIGLKWENLFEKRGFNAFSGPTPHGFTWGLVLLKDLPKTANTVRCFHAQIKIEKGIYRQYLRRNK